MENKKGEEDVPPSYAEAVADGGGALPGQVQGGKQAVPLTRDPRSQPPVQIVTQVRA